MKNRLSKGKRFFAPTLAASIMLALVSSVFADTIYLRNGQEVKDAVVTEINVSDVKYKVEKREAVYTAKKADIMLILYDDGTKDMFEEETKEKEKYIPAIKVAESEEKKNSSSTSVQGIYFDIGLGFGTGSTEIDGVNIYDELKHNSSINETKLDLTLFKLGYGPIGNNPIYAVLELSGMAHRIYDSSNYIQYNSYLFGPGVIYYPIPLIQLGTSLGYSWVANQTNFNMIMDKSDGGVAWNISAAVDLGVGNHGCLIGLKYFSSTNKLQILGVDQNSSMFGIFIKYAYRHKINSLSE